MISRHVHLAVCALALAFRPGSAGAQQDDIADAERYFEKADYGRAGQLYSRVIAEYGVRAGCGAYGKRAAIYTLTKDYSNGISFVDKIPEACARAPEVGEQRALLLWAVGKRPEAVEAAEEVVRQRPETFSSLRIVGEYYVTDDPSKSITAYRAYFRYRPDSLASSDAMHRTLLAFASLSVAGGNKDRSNLLKEARKQLEIVEQRFSSDAQATLNAASGLCAVYTAQNEWSRAITVCERVVKDRRRKDARTSSWYNLAISYLGNRRATQARTAALEFVRRGGDQSRGHELVGDSYFADRRWADALRYFDIAEARLGDRASTDLVSKIGQTYRRLGRNDKAAERLKAAWDKDVAGRPRIAVELGEALNALGRHKETIEVVRPFLAKGETRDVQLMLVAADAELGLKRTAEARALYERALRERDDARARRGIIRTFNAEAAIALEAGKSSDALEALRKALKLNPKSIQTNKNLAVISIEAGECRAAIEYLAALKTVRSQQLAYHRLAARAHVCAQKPAEAATLYAQGAKIARQAGNNLALAEIYIEWAPLTFGTDLDGSIEKLNQAVQFTFTVPAVSVAAKRTRARALFLRGQERLAKGEVAKARADLETAVADPKSIEPAELESMRLALALAHVESNNHKQAAEVLASLGNGPLGLKKDYSSLRAGFFKDFARARSREVAQAEGAARAFAASSKAGAPAVRNLARDIAGRAYLEVASLRYEAGKLEAANRALDQAAKLVRDDRMDNVVKHNRVVLRSAGGAAKARRDLQALKQPPVEGLVNLGIAYDAAGDGKRAYDLWQEAKSKGYRSKALDMWIEAKQNIFGYKERRR